jgi:hypothetical protein
VKCHPPEHPSSDGGGDTCDGVLSEREDGFASSLGVVEPTRQESDSCVGCLELQLDGEVPSFGDGLVR